MTNHQLSDEEETEMLEQILSTATAETFRNFVCEEISLQADESVLSVGCGPGFEAAVLAQQVGEGGSVTGIDVNEDVLAAARNRCSNLSQVSFQHGDVTELPVTDESYDLVIAKQVLQFVDDVDSALEELFRVLKPGGRIAVVESARESEVMHSSDPEQMRRANEVYRTVRGDRNFGTQLLSLLPDAGFTVEDVVSRATVQREINEQVERGIEVQRGFLESSDAFDDSEIEAWEQDLRDLDEANQFLFCGITLLYISRKPE
ncbi:methyltransferase domain-containing protein [Halosimplex amylolyticum]|uniref:methyltransferase domain-containing protein n=1 Tax=Halosimplex amylolyticum TaxID=3396616 RepID=UPI003F57CF21